MAEMFTAVVPTPADWKRSGRKVTRAMERAMQLTAEEAWRNVSDGAPVDDGVLAGSWELDQEGKLAWRLYTKVAYAEVVSKGSVPHVIEARNARALAFQMNGETVIVRKVNHPGTDPNPYVEDGIDAATARTNEFMRRAMAEAA